MQEGDLNIFQGANNKLNELKATIQQAKQAIKEGDGSVLGPLASCWRLGAIGAST
jgi:hypothetical protein